jgi:hypothetical protein
MRTTFGARVGASETQPENASDDNANNNVFDFDMFQPPEVSTAISSTMMRSSQALLLSYSFLRKHHDVEAVRSPKFARVLTKTV